jgi:type I restriction enzyme S subunit
MKYRVYPAYKVSGVEWLGEVPEHWQIRHLGAYGKFIAGCGFPHEYQGSKNDQYPFYKVSDTNLEGNEVYLKNSENTVTAEIAKKLGANISEPGGIMFPKVGATLLKNKRRILTKPSITDNNIMVFMPINGDNKYWYYWLSEIDFGQISNPGPVPSVNEFQLKSFPAIAPPLEEQRAIATFLDKETTKIDTLIEKQQKLIELLKEKRQALISHAVTKGLNPNVPLKDSGVEWLGEVPGHWDIKKLKFVASVHPSNVDKKSYDDQQKVYLCNYTEVYNNDLISKDMPFMKATATKKQIQKFTLKAGDTIITKDSEDPNDIAVPAFVLNNMESVLCGYHLAIIRPFEGICGAYLKRVLDSTYARSTFATKANGITRYGLSTYAINNVIFPLPPYTEQQQIATFLDKETTKINTLIKKASQAIALLKERRTALISAAVTGKIDVRHK